MIKIKISI